MITPVGTPTAPGRSPRAPTPSPAGAASRSAPCRPAAPPAQTARKAHPPARLPAKLSAAPRRSSATASYRSALPAHRPHAKSSTPQRSAPAFPESPRECKDSAPCSFSLGRAARNPLRKQSNTYPLVILSEARDPLFAAAHFLPQADAKSRLARITTPSATTDAYLPSPRRTPHCPKAHPDAAPAFAPKAAAPNPVPAKPPHLLP